MENITLEASVRTITKKKVSALRKKSTIPAIIYGHGTANTLLTVASVPFQKAFEKAGESTLIDLVIDGKPSVKVLVHDFQRDPIKGQFTHADFYQVNMKEKLETSIQLNFVGEPRAVKELGGTFEPSMHEIEVRCLPSDLVHEITVDVTNLATFDDAIKVKDLPIPAGLEVLDDPEQTVAVVVAPMSEEELKALDEAVVEDVSQVQSAKPKKEEDAAEEKK